MYNIKFGNLNLYNIFLYVILFVFAILILILAKQNTDLRNQLLGNIPKLKEGDNFELVEVQDLYGNKNNLQIDKTTIIYLFTTKCPICTQNLQFWDKIYENKKIDTRVVALSLDHLDSTKEYANKHKLPYSIYVVLDVGLFREKNRIYGVPTTLLLDSLCKVKKIYLGLLKEEDIIELNE